MDKVTRLRQTNKHTSKADKKKQVGTNAVINKK